jgi:hypothetical protein
VTNNQVPPPHVDLEQVVGAINDHLGAHYSSFTKYNREKYTPLKSQKDQDQTRSDSKKFARSKGHCKQFSQAAFGFPKSRIPSAKLHKGGARVNSHIFPLFAVTTGWAGGDEVACILRFWSPKAAGFVKPPDLLQPLIQELTVAHDGKSFYLEHEDKEGFSESIKAIAGLVEETVDYMEAVETKLTKAAETKRTPAVVGPQVLARQPLKREVVNRYWGFAEHSGVCFGGCGKQMVYDEAQLAHWRPKGELNEANGFVAATAKVSWLLTHIVLFHS